MAVNLRQEYRFMNIRILRFQKLATLLPEEQF